MSSVHFPKARLDKLIVTLNGDDKLVYDEVAFVVHSLELPAATVWSLADGSRSVGEIISSAQAASLSEAQVREALHQLANAGLLEHGDLWLQPTVSRRSRRMIILGGTATAATMVVSVSAPTAAQTGSPAAGSCTPLGEEDCRIVPCCPNDRGEIPSCSRWGFCEA